MAVYVDDMSASFGRMKMCHMIADSHDELVKMADGIGVARKWIQYPGTWKEHFDVCQSMRIEAILAGALPITQRELCQRQIQKRQAPAHNQEGT